MQDTLSPAISIFPLPLKAVRTANQEDAGEEQSSLQQLPAWT